MSARISRRAVLAFIALTTDEASAPNTVEFREYTSDGKDWHVVELTADSEAGVRFWAEAFGHPEEYLSHYDHVLNDGRRSTTHRSQAPGWRGWTTVVAARIGQPADVPLDVDTVEQLRVIADETPADSRPRGAADRPAAAGNGDADPAPTTPGAGSADLDAQPDGDQ